MYQVACPACGAQVEFRSTAAVMAVCAYCHSTLLRDENSVRDIGKISAVLEDYSPIQITSCGTFDGRNFNVVGRIQLQYADGYWNEWYLWFDDGTGGWLSDASGQYTITVEASEPIGKALLFDKIQAGASLNYDKDQWVAADVRTAKCIAGEGELPMRVGDGWVAKVADYRSARRFLSLDFSDSETPVVYLGKAVTLDSARMERLRSTDQILASAGRVPGSITPLACPACGATIAYVAGRAANLVCSSCHAGVALSGDKAAVLDVASKAAAYVSTLALGDIGKINGDSLRVIGLMRCREMSSYGESWTEYLLYSPQKQLCWLVETEEHWDLVNIRDDWPVVNGSQVRMDGLAYTKMYDYRREVTYAAGAFNWRVKVGEVRRVSEYANGPRRATAEFNEEELVWSLGSRVSAKTVAQWFNRPDLAKNAQTAKSLTNDDSDTDDESGTKRLIWIFSAVLLALNLPLLLLDRGNIGTTLFGLALLWFPVWRGEGGDD